MKAGTESAIEGTSLGALWSTARRKRCYGGVPAALARLQLTYGSVLHEPEPDAKAAPRGEVALIEVKSRRAGITVRLFQRGSTPAAPKL